MFVNNAERYRAYNLTTQMYTGWYKTPSEAVIAALRKEHPRDSEFMYRLKYGNLSWNRVLSRLCYTDTKIESSYVVRLYSVLSEYGKYTNHRPNNFLDFRPNNYKVVSEKEAMAYTKSNDNVYAIALVRNIAVYDSSYGLMNPDTLKEFTWVNISDIKKPKKATYIFRRGPVPYTRCHHWRYYRRMGYKYTQLIAQDDQCIEFNIKPCREKTILNAYDIEPVRCQSKSWKDNTKCRKQWMRHKKYTNDMSRVPKGLYVA